MENFASISNRYKGIVEEHLKRLPLSDLLRKNWNVLTKIMGAFVLADIEDWATEKAKNANGGSGGGGIALVAPLGTAKIGNTLTDAPTTTVKGTKTDAGAWVGASEGGGMKGHGDSNDKNTSTSSSLNAFTTDNAPPFFCNVPQDDFAHSGKYKLQ